MDVCVLSSHLFWTSDFCGRTSQGHTCFLHLSSAMLALIFIAIRIQPSFSLVDRVVEFCVSFSPSWVLLFFIYRSRLSYLIILCGKFPVRVTASRFELTSQRQKVSRLPTEPPGRPACIYSKSKDQPGRVANPARGQLNKENECFAVSVRA